jgi:NAD(P)-dependent dehydrogenase (short-subunit alcohol dehydrogenase family)
MEKKTIVVVGAGPGLGLAIAKRFGKEGFRAPVQIEI